MKLTCNIHDCDTTIKLNSPILLEKGTVLEYDDKTFSVEKIDKVEFDTDGNLEGATLSLELIHH